jgi:branched-chain amino acid transport system ATP-binding protein
MAFLEIRKLTKHFGGLVVLNDIELNIEQGEILGLIGPNGAGKTTLFNIIVGVYKPTAGSIIFGNEEITGLKPHKVAERGIIKTYQANVSFRDLTVTDNVVIGHHLQVGTSFSGVFFNSSTARKNAEKIKNNTAKTLKFFGLSHKQNELSGELPHGYQRLLGIATAIAAKPKLLLLDEPITGMNAEEASFTVEIIRSLRKAGITIVVVEHDMKVVMDLCERIVVLNFGKKIADGSPDAIRGNKNVIEAYLGVD